MSMESHRIAICANGVPKERDFVFSQYNTSIKSGQIV
jgi:hypothetical protein